LHLTDTQYTGTCKEKRMQVQATDIDGTADHGYLLGHSTQEQRRLAEQGVILQPITERLFRDAGLRRGMRVLDVGCGVGDVTCLVAQIVGSEGAVVGVDFAGTVLSTARSRAASRGLRWTRFVEADIAQVSLSDLSIQRFDAVVGRLVLMYQADMERLGIATAEEIDIDTLADRLVEEAESAPGSVCGLALGGAWVRTPTPQVHRATPADATVLKGSWPPRWPLNSTSAESQGKV
jgi:SAM-dependent methyltransferase